MSSSNIESELYYLVAKYLESGPCVRSAQLLKREIEENSLLPQRFDWLGDRHDISFDELNRQNSHISSQHLLKIVERITQLLDAVIPPSVSGVSSLLGNGRQSLLRDHNNTVNKLYSSRHLSSFRNGAQLLPSPHSMVTHPYNIVNSLISRENSGPLSHRQLLPTKYYDKIIKYRRLLGHLSSVYCVSFDRTGRYIFTGADDSLVKIWSAFDGRLLSTLRGHINEITDLSVNYENTLIAAGSCDKMIRVWCLKTTAPITVLSGHNAQITSVKFCPLARDDNRFLVSTANDGCVCFWRYNANNNEFQSRPIKFTERHKPGSQLVCSSFSSGGIFLAVGSTDNYLRVYHITAPAGPTKILEIEQHSDHVDSIQFSNLSTRFVSGSRDGVAHIWYFERQHWHNIPLKMSERLPGSDRPVNEEISRKVRVSMVGWTCDDVHVITSLSDHSLKVWYSQTGQLRHVLYGHEEEVFVIEAHPKDSRIFLSGGHDGAIILWDVISGSVLKTFFNSIDGQGHGAVFDCKFSPDGTMFASTDSHGHLTFFGMMSSTPYKKVPDQVFFHTDYRPVIRDNNQYAIDEQTQCAPHLMPPPFLVDIDGNPYPPSFQRLVPGRENCSDSQLVPYVAVHNANGNDIAEVLAPVEIPGPQIAASPQPSSVRTTIDDMIQRLQREQRRLNHEHDYTAQPPPGYHDRGQQPNESPRARHSSRSQRTAGSRRTGDVEGVRQPANFMSRDRELNLMVPIWAKKMVVTPLSFSEASKAKLRSMSVADAEEVFFNKERKKRPQVEDASVNLKLAIKEERFTRRKRRIIQQRQGVRQSSMRDRYARRPDGRHNGITDYENPEDLSDDSDSDYTGDQEWADTSSTSESEESEDSEWDSNFPSTSRLRKRNASSIEEEDDYRESGEERKPSTKLDKKQVKKVREKMKRQQLEEKYNSFKELPDEFRPPEWFTDVHPKKTPYFPQMGDEVVYFRQGHQHYIDTIRETKMYPINPNLKPYKLRGNQSDEVFAKIVDIKYDVKPPRLVTVKLLVIDRETNEQTNAHFSIRYHDVENVVDFIILRQYYDLSISRKWKVGDEFRSIIDDKWWFGTIKCLKESSPFSNFKCYDVLWASGDSEFLSPWDLEPINEESVPPNRCESVPVTDHERLSFNLSNPDEWPECGKVEECQRIVNGLIRIMDFSQAEEFSVPVDLNKHPVYGMMISYPMDLSTIKARIENHFYRRVESIKFDIKFIEQNAQHFNEPGSEIVKKAKIVCALITRFIEDEQSYDPMPIYLDIIAHIDDFDDPVVEDDKDEEEEYREVRRSSRKKRRRSGSESEASEEIQMKQKKKRLKGDSYRPRTWKQNCKDLLNYILEREDSSPFRSPVDPIQYPDYSQVIDTPMDLTTVKEQLLADLYDSPNEFCKDMRLIFQNSKSFNTNKKSRIYSMTVRLSGLFEDKMRRIISDWRSTNKYENNLKRGIISNRRKPIPLSPISANRSPNKRLPNNKRSRRAISSSISPSFDISLPSTSGYSSRSKSSQNSNRRNLTNSMSTKLSPKKKNANNANIQKLRKQNGVNNNFKNRRTDSLFKRKPNNNTNSDSNTKKEVVRKGRKRRIVEQLDDEETEKESIEYAMDDETLINEEIVKHFDSDTEIEDDRKDSNNKRDADSDATEIDENEAADDTSIIRQQSRRRKQTMRTSYSEHTYSLPPRRSKILSRRRLKASEESESTQSSLASSSHSNYSNESQSSAASTLSRAPSEASEQSYISDDDNLRRSSRKGRGINDKWRTVYESEDDLRRVSLGLRNKRRSSGKRFNMDSTIKTRSRNSGKERVRYTYDDDDYEYDNNATHMSETVSSRGRVRKFKAHARFATH